MLQTRNVMENTAPEDLTGELARRYDADAVAYRDYWSPVLIQAAGPLLNALGPAPAQNILDIGTGIGALYPSLRQKYPAASIVGVDRSPGMLALAPAELCRALADARRLPVAGGSVDLALMVFVLFHIESPADALREARRVLRPGGRIATATWGGELESEATRVWRGFLDQFGAAETSGPSRHELVDSAAKVSALLEQAEFDSIRVWESELAVTIPLDHFVKLKTGVGSDKRRLDNLAANDRTECIAAALRRLATLDAEAFRAAGKIVYAIAG